MAAFFVMDINIFLLLFVAYLFSDVQSGVWLHLFCVN